MIDRIADIERRSVYDHFNVLWAQIALVACGSSGPKLPGANPFARRYQSSRGDPRVSFDDRAVHNARLHTDETFILQGARMDEREMAHRYVRAYSRAFRSFSCDVNDSAILYVGPSADSDGSDVRTHDGAIPNTRVLAKRHIADQDGSVGNEGAWRERRRSIAESDQLMGEHGVQRRSARRREVSCSSNVSPFMATR